MEFAVLLGPPGSGKGTIAAAIVEQTAFEHISTGARIRMEMQVAGSEIGDVSRPYMQRSEFVPDDVAMRLVEMILAEGEAERSLLFDGFPRTASQGLAFDRMVEARGDRFIGAFSLEASDSELAVRLAGRRCCATCGAVFNQNWNRPQKDGTCDHCGGPLVQRLDDLEENVEKRIGLHKTQAVGLVEYYREQGVLHGVDATQALADTVQQIINILHR